jgi:hypothetical protein
MCPPPTNLSHCQRVADAIREAINAIHRCIGTGTWTPQQRQRLRRLNPHHSPSLRRCPALVEA